MSDQPNETSVGITNEDLEAATMLLALIEMDWAEGLAALCKTVAHARAHTGAKSADEDTISETAEKLAFAATFTKGGAALSGASQDDAPVGQRAPEKGTLA